MNTPPSPSAAGAEPDQAVIAAEENAYERALARELSVYEDGAAAWQFQILIAGAPLGVLFGAERATLFPGEATHLFQMGMTLLVAALALASLGALLVINAKSRVAGLMARCMIEHGQITHTVAARIVRERVVALVPLTIISLGYYATLVVAAVLLLAEAGLLYRMPLGASPTG